MYRLCCCCCCCGCWTVDKHDTGARARHTHTHTKTRDGLNKWFPQRRPHLIRLGFAGRDTGRTHTPRHASLSLALYRLVELDGQAPMHFTLLQVYYLKSPRQFSIIISRNGSSTLLTVLHSNYLISMCACVFGALSATSQLLLFYFRDE